MKEKLSELLKNSYAPYSNYHFACIVECKNGNMYEGVNVENASFGATICAERHAINNAISHGEREFSALYLMGDKENILYPCNLCKQEMLQFFDRNVIFNIMNKYGESKVLTFDELMKTTFSKDDME